jgi:hypothetical protein
VGKSSLTCVPLDSIIHKADAATCYLLLGKLFLFTPEQAESKDFNFVLRRPSHEPVVPKNIALRGSHVPISVREKRGVTAPQATALSSPCFARFLVTNTVDVVLFALHNPCLPPIHHLAVAVPLGLAPPALAPAQRHSISLRQPPLACSPSPSLLRRLRPSTSSLPATSSPLAGLSQT